MSSRCSSANTDSIPKRGAAFGGGGVDALLEHPQPDAAVAEVGAEHHQVHHRTTQPVQPGHHKRVTVAQQCHRQVQLRAGGLHAAGNIDMNVLGFHAGAAQRVDLVGGVLLGGRHSGVPDQHTSDTSGERVCRR